MYNSIDFQLHLTILTKQNICTKALQNLPQTLEALSIFPHYGWNVLHGSLTNPSTCRGIGWGALDPAVALQAPLLQACSKKNTLPCQAGRARCPNSIWELGTRLPPKSNPHTAKTTNETGTFGH